MELKETEICECMCHIEGKSIMHCMPCCDLCEMKYIGEDGQIDMVKWAVAFREAHKNVPTVKNKDGKVYWVHK